MQIPSVLTASDFFLGFQHVATGIFPRLACTWSVAICVEDSSRCWPDMLRVEFCSAAIFFLVYRGQARSAMTDSWPPAYSFSARAMSSLYAGSRCATCRQICRMRPGQVSGTRILAEIWAPRASFGSRSVEDMRDSEVGVVLARWWQAPSWMTARACRCLIGWSPSRSSSHGVSSGPGTLLISPMDSTQAVDVAAHRDHPGKLRDLGVYLDYDCPVFGLESTPRRW